MMILMVMGVFYPVTFLGMLVFVNVIAIMRQEWLLLGFNLCLPTAYPPPS